MWEEWLMPGSVGVGVTSLVTVLGFWFNTRRDHRKLKVETKTNQERTKREARAAAVEAADAAVDVVQKAMSVQERRLQELSERLTDHSQRITSLTRLHTLALTHIADREAWTAARWTKRPRSLPQIPDELRADIDPLIRVPRNHTKNREDEDEDRTVDYRPDLGP